MRFYRDLGQDRKKNSPSTSTSQENKVNQRRLILLLNINVASFFRARK